MFRYSSSISGECGLVWSQVYKETCNQLRCSHTLKNCKCQAWWTGLVAITIEFLPTAHVHKQSQPICFLLPNLLMLSWCAEGIRQDIRKHEISVKSKLSFNNLLVGSGAPYLSLYSLFGNNCMQHKYQASVPELVGASTHPTLGCTEALAPFSMEQSKGNNACSNIDYQVSGNVKLAAITWGCQPLHLRQVFW